MGTVADAFDVIVVGAGPGGSNAAAACLDGGLSVLQLEARAFPRVKPCAGGVTPKSLSALRGEVGDQLRGEARTVEFTDSAGNGVSFEPGTALLRYVHRPDFDAELVRRNRLRPGFGFREEEPVVALHWDGRFTVETAARRYVADQLIGADGSNGIVNRTFEVCHPRGRATAIEIEIPRPGGSEACPDPCFDFGAVPGGYGWVFPKDRYWSVGLYTIEPSLPRLRERLEAYLREKRLSDFDRGRVLGHRYPLGGYRFSLPKLPVYVVGDAGGFAEAITGEGIYAALQSGALAGETAVLVHGRRARPGDYYRRLWRSVLWDTRISWHAARFFYRDPERWIGWLRNPLVWRPLVEGYAEGATLSACLFWGWLYLLRSRKARCRKGVRG